MKKTILSLLIIIHTQQIFLKPNASSLPTKLTKGLTYNAQQLAIKEFKKAVNIDPRKLESYGPVVGFILISIGIMAKAQIFKASTIIGNTVDKNYVKIRTFIQDKFNTSNDPQKKIALAQEFGNDFVRINKGDMGKTYMEILKMCNKYQININDLKTHVQKQINDLAQKIKANNTAINDNVTQNLYSDTADMFTQLNQAQKLQKTLNMPNDIDNIIKKNTSAKNTPNVISPVTKTPDEDTKANTLTPEEKIDPT